MTERRTARLRRKENVADVRRMVRLVLLGEPKWNLVAKLAVQSVKPT